MTMGRDKRRAAVAMAVVFVAGAIVGLAATRVYHHRHGGMGGRLSAEEYRTHLLDQLTEDLGLDAEQQQSVEEILDEIDERFREVRDAIEPEMEAIRGERAARIMSLLDQEQEAKYEQILEQRRHRREEQSQRSNRRRR